jgi:hypothetical protein
MADCPVYTPPKTALSGIDLHAELVAEIPSHKQMGEEPPL